MELNYTFIGIAFPLDDKGEVRWSAPEHIGGSFALDDFDQFSTEDDKEKGAAAYVSNGEGDYWMIPEAELEMLQKVG